MSHSNLSVPGTKQNEGETHAGMALSWVGANHWVASGAASLALRLCGLILIKTFSSRIPESRWAAPGSAHAAARLGSPRGPSALANDPTHGSHGAEQHKAGPLGPPPVSSLELRPQFWNDDGIWGRKSKRRNSVTRTKFEAPASR